MAGQREFRNNAGDRMRYKILHKFHDYKARFGKRHMCVGCGRCAHRCPELISISATVSKVNDAVDRSKPRWHSRGGKSMENFVQPKPCTILNVKRESEHEWTSGLPPKPNRTTDS